MSYILDALRRAEAERQRGAVPGLHAQPTTAAIADGTLAAARPSRLAWGVAAAALLAAGGLAVVLWLTRQPPVVAVAPAVAVAPGVAMVPGVAVAPAGLPAVQPAVPAAPPSPQSVTVPAVAAMPSPVPSPPTPPQRMPQALPLPAAGPPPLPPVARPAPAGPAAAPVATAKPAGPASAVMPAGAAAPASAVSTRLPTLAELPEALRRDLPPLAAGGSMFAEQPAMRIVILNGQVFHEGDRPAAELQVQQIRPKSVVLVFRGQRFELPL